MLISDNSLLSTHNEITKRKSLNATFDKFCLQIFSFRTSIQNNEDNINPSDIYSQFELFLKNNLLNFSSSKTESRSFIDEYLGEAMYAMCALADEIFLCMDWTGRSFWERHLLESAFFNTHVSGEEIFRRIDILLQEGNPIFYDLGEIYLKMLALGYTGKYRGATEAKTEIDNYRDKLYQFVIHSDRTAAIVNNRIFDEEYKNIMSPINKILLPDPRMWNYSIGIYLLCFTLISIVYWHIETSGMINKMEEIEEIAIQGADE